MEFHQISRQPGGAGAETLRASDTPEKIEDDLRKMFAWTEPDSD